MGNVSITSSYDKWKTSGAVDDWNIPIILYDPVPNPDDFKLRVQTNSTDIGIGDTVDFVQVTGDSTDLYDATLTADNSTTVAAIVPDTQFNLQQLAASNDVDTYVGLTKSTACFDDNTYIDVIILHNGMIVTLKVIDSVGAGGYKAFSRVQSAGSGRVDVYATGGALLGILLTQTLHVAAMQWVAVMINRGY